jgi:hypothetical protein
MMQATLFEMLAGVAGLSAPGKVGPFGRVPQDTPLPYLTWQTITGQPQNYLDDVPDIDQTRVQMDIWAATGDAAETLAQSVRDALETKGYMISFGTTDQDPATNAFRFSMDFDFWTPR